MSGEGLTSGVTNKGQEESVGKYWLHKKRFLTSKKKGTTVRGQKDFARRGGKVWKMERLSIGRE